MSGLQFTLAPGERFIINGALMENGDRPARIRIKDRDARFLRCSDALKPEDVNTPVKRVYYAIQLLITGDLDDARTLPALMAECRALENVFSTVNPTLIPTLKSMIERGNYYSGLCHLRQIIVLEAQLLDMRTSNDPEPETLKVA